MTYPDFRARLRAHYLDLQAQHRDLERGTPAWFDCEKAIFATARLHVSLYREAIEPLHNGPHPDSKKPASPEGPAGLERLKGRVG